MIIQFNLIATDRYRQYGHKLFYHLKGASPSDYQVLKIIEDYYALDLKLREKKRITDPFIIETPNGTPFAEVFPIFCTYDKDGSISLDYLEFRHVEWDGRGWYVHRPDKVI